MVLDVKLNKVFKNTSKDDSTVRQTSACSLCKSESLVTDIDSGEVICSKCGVVISEKTQETRSLRPSNGLLTTTFLDGSNKSKKYRLGLGSAASATITLQFLILK